MFNENMKSIRKKKNLKQTTISKAIKISQSAYSQYENGNMIPNIDIIIKLASYYNMSIDDLVGHTIKSQEHRFIQLFNKLDNIEKTEILNYIQYKVDNKDKGKSYNFQNKKDNVG